MKKALVGFVAVGAGVGLLVAARRMSQEMRGHCKQMKAHCTQMATQSDEREIVGTA
jgi:hypothetical protein